MNVCAYMFVDLLTTRQVRVLCTESPTLLDDLLDGLLWTAKSASTTEAGSIRVNYYVCYTRMHTLTRRERETGRETERQRGRGRKRSGRERGRD